MALPPGYGELPLKDHLGTSIAEGRDGHLIATAAGTFAVVAP